MPSKKVYISLLVILVVFGLVMFFLFGTRNIQEENFSSTIIVGDNTTWVLKNKKWILLRNRTSIDNLNWKEYHVFIDDKDIGKYTLWHDDKWYMFDKNKNAVVEDGKFLAYAANYEMKVLKFSEEKVDDFTYVNTVLKNNNISTSSKFTSIYKSDVDYDSDGEEEEFYIISNAFPLDFEPEISFSIAFMVKNDTIYTIYNDVSSNKGLNGCKPFYNSFIDTNDDGLYEVILSCGRFSADDQIDMLYQFENKDFNLLISNQ